MPFLNLHKEIKAVILKSPPRKEELGGREKKRESIPFQENGMWGGSELLSSYIGSKLSTWKWGSEEGTSDKSTLGTNKYFK